MLKTILDYIFPPKSVASITSSLTKTVTELEAHIEDQAEKAKAKLAVSAQAIKEHVEHTKEADLASKVVTNIKALIGA
jgi:hypothetical protein